MKILMNHKDGGPESKVWCYGIEFKSLFSIILLRFENGSREAYHSHAFNCLNWVLKGDLYEERITDIQELDGPDYRYKTSWLPFVIRRKDLHRVTSIGRSWVLTLRGPWNNTWIEYLPNQKKFIRLTNGRRELFL